MTNEEAIILAEQIIEELKTCQGCDQETAEEVKIKQLAILIKNIINAVN